MFTNIQRRKRLSHSHYWCKWAVWHLLCRVCLGHTIVVAPGKTAIPCDLCSCGAFDWEIVEDD